MNYEEIAGRARRRHARTAGIPASMQTRALEKLQRGTYSDQGESITWEYYDEAAIPATAGTVQMFQQPIGGTKTLGQTNMVASGQIPQGQHFTVTSIHVMYRGAEATPAEANELLQLLDRAVLQFKIQNKAPMIQTKLSSAMGLSLMAPVTGTAGTTSSMNGVFMGNLKLKTPITLAGLVPFNVELVLSETPAASVVGDLFTVVLRGDLVRAL